MKMDKGDVVRLASAHTSLHRVLEWPLAATEGLMVSVTDALMLCLVSGAGKGSAVFLAELSDSTALPLPVVARACSRLEQNGLMQSTTGRLHRLRGFKVTPKGQKVLSAYIGALNELADRCDETVKAVIHGITKGDADIVIPTREQKDGGRREGEEQVREALGDVQRGGESGA